MRALLFGLALAGCTTTTTTGDDVDPPDAGPTATCDLTAAFSAPVAVGGLDGAPEELGARFSTDERTVYDAAPGTGSHFTVSRPLPACTEMFGGSGSALLACSTKLLTDHADAVPAATGCTAYW